MCQIILTMDLLTQCQDLVKIKVIYIGGIINNILDMDYRRRTNERGDICWFHSFVFGSLVILLGIHVYSYFLSPAQESMEGDFSDIKYIIMQLTRSLADVTHKHDRLQGEVERLSSELPQVALAADRQDTLDSQGCPGCPGNKNTGLSQTLEILKYDRQVADYALETAGARILDTGDTAEYVHLDSPVSWALHTLTSFVCRGCFAARAMIRPSTLPGECWAFKGSRGEATIQLSGTVKIIGFSIEHIPPQISLTREISSAPRLCQVEGLEFRGDPYPHDFGSFEFDKDGTPIQYFKVGYPSAKGYNIVRLRVLTNWGNPVYTCVYRFRVHGELVPGQGPKVVLDEKDMFIENE